MTHKLMTAENVYDTGTNNKWLIDSGASNHFTANRDLLLDFPPIQPKYICTGNGFITTHEIGDVVVHFPQDITIIQPVIWVPGLQGFSNLLSIPQLTNMV